MLDAKTLLERHINARGGLNALLNIHTLYVSGTMTDHSGTTARVEGWRKRPNLLRMQVTAPNAIVAEGFDGARAWEGGTHPAYINGDAFFSLRRESEFDGPLVQASLKGHQITSLGECVVAGLPVYGLRVTLRDGTEATYYLHKQTYMVAASELVNPASPSVMTLYTDYQLVGGAMYSHYVVQISEQGTLNETYSWRAFTANAPIDDSFFALPAFVAPSEN